MRSYSRGAHESRSNPASFMNHKNRSGIPYAVDSFRSLGRLVAALQSSRSRNLPPGPRRTLYPFNSCTLWTVRYRICRDQHNCFFKPSSPRRRRLIRQESNIRGRTYSQCSTRIFRSRGVGRGYSDSAIRNMFAEQTPHKIGVCFSTAQRALATKLSCSTFDEKATYKRFSF